MRFNVTDEIVSLYTRRFTGMFSLTGRFMCMTSGFFFFPRRYGAERKNLAIWLIS